MPPVLCCRSARDKGFLKIVSGWEKIAHMREPRIYVEMDLAGEDSLDLPATSAHHVSRVLRMRSGQRLWLFNGNGPAELAEIVAIDRPQW